MSLGGYSGRRRGRSGCGLAALAALGVAGGLGLALLLAVPRVVAVSPRPGEESAGSRGPVRLTFSTVMDTGSVEAGLRLEPARPGRFRWERNGLTFVPDEGWPPGTAVTMTLEGARSQRGLPVVGREVWTFMVGQRRLAYLSGDPSNLWLTEVEPAGDGTTPAARVLTAEPAGIYDYAISPDGTQLVYSARRPDGGSDLRVVAADSGAADGAVPAGGRDLLACPGEACIGPSFSPDGTRLAYQRHSLVTGVSGSLDLGPSRVHVLELTGAASLQAGADQVLSEGEARFPRWGPDGRLTYLDLQRSAIVVAGLATGAITYVPSTSGEMGTWSPDGQYLVYPELYFPPEPTPDAASGAEPENSDRFYSYLVRVTVATNATTSLSGSGVVDDASPAFSPAGDWLAFGRKALYLGQWTPGRQLWLMRADGSLAHALTADPLYNHSAFRWSPDGTSLAYMRFDTSEPGAPAEVWVIDRLLAGEPASGPRLILAGAYLPEWLP